LKSQHQHNSLESANILNTTDFQDDKVSLKEFVLKLEEWYRYLLSKWIVIFSSAIIGVAIGFTYAYLKKPVYIAETTFVLEEGEGRGGLGAYAGLASMIGIDLNAGGGGVFQGDNIIELYRSRKMIQETLLSKGIFTGKQQLLIDRYITFKRLRETWDKKPNLQGIKFNILQNEFTLQHDSIMSKIVEDIKRNYLTVSRPDDKLSILKVEIKSKDELFAKAFADNIVATVNNFYVETKTKKSSENLAILQHQADSVRKSLNYSIGGVAAAADANPNMNSAFQTLRVPSQRKQVDVQASAAVYQEIVKNLELAKVTFRREKPLIQVIDEPVLPLKKDKLGKLTGLILGGILSSVLSIFFLIGRQLLKEIY
jgi:hypothetical protein